MKKIVTFILLTCMLITLVACADKGDESESTAPESTAEEITTAEDTTAEETTGEETTAKETESEEKEETPIITLQEVYDSGKNHIALLGDHENVYLVYNVDGTVIQEEFYDGTYFYAFYNGEHFEWGPDFFTLLSEKAEYFYETVYAVNLTLAPSGMVGVEEYFDLVGTTSFISSEMLNDENPTVVEAEGSIIVSVAADEEELAVMGDDVASCVETYTLDALTREMTSVRTVYTFDDGSVQDGTITIIRDTDMPEAMRPLVNFDQETENLRTVTIVSNPGTADVKTESVQVSKGLTVAISADFLVEETFTLYTDAACTQVFEADTDVNADLTVYVKWGE